MILILIAVLLVLIKKTVAIPFGTATIFLI